MEANIVSHSREFLIVLAAAGLFVPLFLRAGINAVLGFLLIGIILSPTVLGRLTNDLPFLSALIITDPHEIERLGEYGVVFLLFLIGLGLSFERLVLMSRLVFGLGSAQVIVSASVISFVLWWWFGLSAPAASVLGAALSLSSTAIVIELLSNDKRLGSQTGRTTFAVLLFQDIAVIPILLLTSILGTRVAGPVWEGVFWALAQAGLAILLIVGVGRYCLRPLLRLVAGTNSPDLFMAATLLVALGTGFAAQFAGLSMALGAFISGLMLAETEYRRAIEAIIEPFKGLLLGAFFLIVGLSVDFTSLAANPIQIISLVFSVILIKSLLIYCLARLLRVSVGASLETALLLAPCGEFAFVILAQASDLNLLPETTHRDALLVVSLSMMLIPLLARLGKTSKARLAQSVGIIPGLAEPDPPEDSKPSIIIAGFGRVGSLIATMLDEHKIPYIAVDSDANLVSDARKKGLPVYYGDATNIEFLRHCGLAQARALAITMDDTTCTDQLTALAHKARKELVIIVRARDERHAMRLYTAGASEAVPETIESSLQMGESLLVESGIALGLAIASVHDRRDQFRQMLGRTNRRELLDPANRRKHRHSRKPPQHGSES